MRSAARLRAAGLAIICALMYNEAPAQAQPNILFIMSDDHAAHAIGAYGSVINETPHIDRLAAEGMRFTNVFCTNAICAPSRATILTGTYNHVNGVIDNRVRFDSTRITFPKLLRTAGYQTAMIGKWHLKSQPTGFDYWDVLPGQGVYYNPDLIEMGERKRIDGYVTDILTNLALAWLDRRDPRKPFCLLLHHKAPHRNWMPAPEFLTLYDDRDLPVPETFDDDYATRSRAAFEQEMEIARHLFMDFDLKVDTLLPGEKSLRKPWQAALRRMTGEQRAAWHTAYDPKNKKFLASRLRGEALKRWKYQRYLKDYLRTIASVDKSVGRVLDYLDAHGLADKTIVVYTSDQGFFLGDHGWFDKRFMYEEALRMPLLIRYPPGVPAGSVNDAIVANIDFAPTFLDLAGVDVPAAMQGRSLRPLLRGATPDNWRWAHFYHYYEYPGWHMVKKHYGIRTARYKLLHFYDDIDAWELFDLQKDPHEQNNLYGNPAYADRVRLLQAELENLQKQYQDTTAVGK